MKRFLKSKLVLTLTVLLLLVSSVAVALSGNIVHSHAAAATQIPFNVTFTSADCSNPSAIVTVIPSLSKGDKVSGTINYVDINDPSEANQGENLVLTETNGSFTQTVIVDSGTQTLSFTAAANNDSLTACITGEVDTDQQATISGTVTTVTPTPTPSPTPSPVVRKAPYDFNQALNGLVNCNQSNTTGTGEAHVDSVPKTGNLLVDVKARTLAGAAVGRAGVGVMYTASQSGTVKIDAKVLIAGFDLLALVSVPKLGKTAIVSLQSSVEISVARIKPRRDNYSNTGFASRIITPLPSGIIPNPISLVTYKPPKLVTDSLKLNVTAGDQLFICVGIRSKAVAAGLIPLVGFSKILYAKFFGVPTNVQEIKIAYV